MQVVVEEHEALKAFKRLSRVKNGARTVHRHLGYPGGHIEERLPLHVHDEEGIWCHVNDQRDDNRFWNCFGTWLTESENASQSITVEMNPPKSGVYRKTAAVFLKEGSEYFIAHNGRVGGGKPGVGKAAFLDWYPGRLLPVEYPDGAQQDLIVFGPLGASEVIPQLARFVKQVEAFKAGEAPALKRATSAEELGFFYAPEFMGQTKYSTPKNRTADYSHGRVVDALQELLKGHALVGNDKHRDLFCASSKGRVDALFEVKTSLSSGQVYAGIGQLMVHGLPLSKHGRRVLVLPGKPKSRLAQALAALDIDTISYSVLGASVVFEGYEQVVEHLRRR